jgi:N-glycosylase/DNA lyase
MNPEDVKQHYQENREEVQVRLEEFRGLRNSNDYRLFMELCFVILTSQSSAKNAWKAVKQLDNQNFLLEGDRSEIADVLRQNEIQYEENKARYIVRNREFLSQPTLKNPTNELKIGEKLNLEDLEKTRKWLVENIKGLSWKGASHFLRNIGYGDDFAIISNNISKILFKLELIEEAELPKNKEKYLEQEEKVRELAEEVGISIQALDLVLWSMETGEVFK